MWATGLDVKNSKKKAKKICEEIRKNFKPPRIYCEDKNKIYFHEYRINWLQNIKNKIEFNTYSEYQNVILRKIVPYFEPKK